MNLWACPSFFHLSSESKGIVRLNPGSYMLNMFSTTAPHPKLPFCIYSVGKEPGMATPTQNSNTQEAKKEG